MARSNLALRLDDNDSPAFLRIASAVMRDVRRGRLQPGQQLPGSREWAKRLGFHRNTVLAALRELEAQGWVTTSRAKGTFVSRSLPEHLETVQRRGLASLGVSLPPEPDFLQHRPFSLERGVFHLSAGTPDPRLVPVELLARTWRRVVGRNGSRLLEYGEPGGHAGLRSALASHLAELRGVPASAEQVVVTRGSQMAIDLLARAALQPGDAVAVEALGYRPAWEALQLAGAHLHPVPVDGEGLVVGALEKLVKRGRLRAVYVTPHHQYPTTVTMSAARRLQLLALAKRHGLLVMEDDYDHEFHFDGRPVLPLASVDDGGVVAYVGTLSKVLAPGLRLGFVVAPTALAQRLVRLRAVMDRQGDHPMEATVAELLEEGELQRHMRKMRAVYLARRDALAHALRTRLGGVLQFEVPAGGISLWAHVALEVDLQKWLRAALARGVAVQPGARYTFDGLEPQAVRLVFARFNEAELSRAVDLLAASLSPSPLQRRGLG
ncbi:MAG: PLP-dependent aminotransferase family protein [Myxococcaceae bacterium]